MLVYRRCNKHETQLRVTKYHLQVFYNNRQIAAFSVFDLLDLLNGDIKQPNLVKECKDDQGRV